MKVLSIVGARPQFIKVAALHRAILKKKNLEHVILHTGQHYDHNMSGAFFEELDIPKPGFHLELNEHLPASITGMSAAIEIILNRESPGIVLVYGDTNSTLAGALSAKKLHIKLAHIEAGLRSFNKNMPEETNRVETDKLSDLLFCPTIQAEKNLLKEGFDSAVHKIILSGDIMLDAMNYYSKKIDASAESTGLVPVNKFILCTLHRQGLVKSREKLKEVISALNEINKEVKIFMPAHPGFKKAVDDLGIGPNFNLEAPVGYLEMISLLRRCTAVITDSGGLQKEAFFCKKPCITARNETEWTELVLAGVNFLGGDSSAKQIISAYYEAMNCKAGFRETFYGNGDCAEIIVEELVKFLKV